MDQHQQSAETSGEIPAELRERFDELKAQGLYGRKIVQEIRQWGDIGRQLLLETAFSQFSARWAMLILERLAKPSDIPLLIKILAHTDWFMQVQTANILVRFGNQTLQPLLASLALAIPQQRQGILLALGELADPIVVPYILSELENKDSGVRAIAARTLNRLGDARAVPALIRHLKDSDQTVRQYVIYALETIGDPQAVLALNSAIKTEQDYDTRCLILKALGELGDPRAVEPLIEHLSASHNDEQAYTIYALTRLADKRAVPALLALQHDMTPVDIGNPYTLRAVVMRALAAIADPETFDVLLDAINDPDVEVRWSAVYGLGRIGDPRALPALTRALDDFDETQWGAIISEDAEQALRELKTS